MGNKLNPFEEQLKQAANSFESPYDASAWSRLEKELDQVSGVSGKSSIAKWISAAVVVVSVGVGGFYMSQSTDKETTPIEFAEVNTIDESNTEEPEVSAVVASYPEIDVEVEAEPKSVKTEQPLLTNKEEHVVVEDVISTKTEEGNEIVAKEKPTQNTTKNTHNESPKVDRVITKEVIVPVILSDQTIICVGEEVNLELKELTGNMLVWTITNGTSIESESLEYKFTEEGRYSIYATDLETGKKSNKIEIVVNPLPDASFTMNESLQRGAVPVVDFSINALNEKNYQWSLGDGFKAQGENTSRTYRKAKDYEVSLIVTNKYGCTKESEKNYRNNTEYNLLAPTAFSPNLAGDNDYWFPRALASGYYKFELKVFNRSNHEVFSSKDPQDSWDGLVNGSKAKPGEFFIWKAFVTDPNGISEQYTGTILVK